MQPHESRGLSSDQVLKDETQVLPLHVEDVAVSRRRVATSVVRVATVTQSRAHQIDELVTHERIEIERIPVGRTIDAVPPVREEGDTIILSVVEEVLVVERRLVLKEEVRLRRVRVTERHVETVTLREQEAVVTRINAKNQTAGSDRQTSASSFNTPAQE